MKSGWRASWEGVEKDASNGGVDEGLLYHGVQVELSNVLLIELGSMWWETDEYGDVLVCNGRSDGGGVRGMLDRRWCGDREMVVDWGRWVGKKATNEVGCGGNAYGIRGVCCVE